jgi:hypothetical protein
VLAVADLSGEAPAQLLDRRRLAPLDAARARAYLATLAAQLLAGEPDPTTGAATGVHPYLLPCEAIFEARRGKKTLIEAIEDRREIYIERNIGFSSVYGPVPQAVERHEPPAAELAAAMMDARFGLLFELLQPAEDAP